MAQSDKNTAAYNNQSISMLKGADRVRKRPAVIFGSDGLEGCEHSFFEILSNSVDEAREGHGNEIIVTVWRDHTLQVEDFGRGVPLGYNEREGHSIKFAKGEPVSELETHPLEKRGKKRGTIIRWRPDLDVFTDIAIPRDFFEGTLQRQSVVNKGLKFVLHYEKEDGGFDTEEFVYENGIADYIREIANGTALTEPVLWTLECSGRDREDKDDYKLRAEVAFCFSNTVNRIEYYHNSSFLEHGGSPDKAVRTAFVYAADKYLKAAGAYKKNESKIGFADIEDCLILIINSFSTQTSYENQTKKAITNVFIKDALTDFLKHNLEVYFAEHPADGEIFARQVMANKRARESPEQTPSVIK